MREHVPSFVEIQHQVVNQWLKFVDEILSWFFISATQDKYFVIIFNWKSRSLAVMDCRTPKYLVPRFALALPEKEHWTAGKSEIWTSFLWTLLLD